MMIGWVESSWMPGMDLPDWKGLEKIKKAGMALHVEFRGTVSSGQGTLSSVLSVFTGGTTPMEER